MSKIKSVTEFTVVRSKWYRGQTSDGSRLLRSDDRMCCVGFLSKACGAKDSQIFDRTVLYAPDEAALEHERVADIGLYDMSLAIWNSSIYQDNDLSIISDTEREIRLTKQFADIGITVTFVD